MRVLVIAPHPDDEILGVGGTIAKLTQAGHDVHVTIITSGQPPLFDEESVRKVRSEALAAHQIVGLENTRFMEGFPAAGLDTVPGSLLNAAISEELDRIVPDVLFIPFGGDIHYDHQTVFTASLVAARPHRKRIIKAILAYETLSETNWYAPPITPGFMPNTFVDISSVLEAKISAFAAYESQVQESPHERSLDAVRALARVRGATVGVEAAEAFILVRQLVSSASTLDLGSHWESTATQATSS